MHLSLHPGRNRWFNRVLSPDVVSGRTESLHSEITCQHYGYIIHFLGFISSYECRIVYSFNGPKNQTKNSEWCDGYHRRDYKDNLLDKKYLTNIISHDVNTFVVNTINYLKYGIRDQFVILVKYTYTEHHNKVYDIAA